MAFTKTPEQSTYKTQRFNFVGSPQQRSGTSTKDQRFINLYPELIKTEITEGKKYYLKKRPGMVANATPNISGAGRGAVLFDGKLYTVVGSKLYKDNVSILNINGTTGKVGFAEGDGPYKYLFVADGTQAWVIKTDGTITQVTDADFPTPHIAQPIFMDGYICVAKSNTADIYSCALDDPLTWNNDFITAEMYPDSVVGLSKNNNYFLAYGNYNVEYFYDNANATGTPFERNASAVLQMGCAAFGTISVGEQETVFVGSAGQGGKTIWMIEGFKVTEIGIEPVKESLDSEGASISNASGYIIRHSGHKWFVLLLTSRTWVYDFDEKLWHEWNYNGGVFPFNYAADNPASTPYLLNNTTGYTVTLSDTSYQDIGASAAAVTMTCTVVTVKIDFESFNRKFCHRFTLLGDVPNDSADTMVSVYYSDDDYKTYSTARSLNFNNSMATLTQLGSFRRRAFKIIFADNYPFRLEGYELDINIGQQ